jgi:hypothetical protein
MKHGSKGRSFCVLAAVAVVGCDPIIGIEDTSASAGRDAGASDGRAWKLDPVHVKPAVPKPNVAADASVDAAITHAMDSGSDARDDVASNRPKHPGDHKPPPADETNDSDGGDDETDGGGVGAGDVRAPSEFAGLVFWLDAARGVESSGLAGNMTVGHWNDRSSQGNHAAQADVAHQPMLLAGAVNSLPAIRFNGHGSYLEVGDSTSLDLSTDDFVVVMVAAWDNVTANDMSAAGDSWGYGLLMAKQTYGSPEGGFVMFANAYAQAGSYLEGRLWFIVGDPQIDPPLYATASVNDQLNDGQFRVYSARRNEQTMIQARVNGAPVGEGTIPSALNLSAPGQPMRIGGQADPNLKQSLSGAISEIVIIRGSTSDSDLEQLERHFNRKYQLWQ